MRTKDKEDWKERFNFPKQSGDCTRYTDGSVINLGDGEYQIKGVDPKEIVASNGYCDKSLLSLIREFESDKGSDMLKVIEAIKSKVTINVKLIE
jgi:hypothetical protein